MTTPKIKFEPTTIQYPTYEELYCEQLREMDEGSTVDEVFEKPSEYSKAVFMVRGVAMFISGTAKNTGGQEMFYFTPLLETIVTHRASKTITATNFIGWMKMDGEIVKYNNEKRIVRFENVFDDGQCKDRWALCRHQDGTITICGDDRYCAMKCSGLLRYWSDDLLVEVLGYLVVED